MEQPEPESRHAYVPNTGRWLDAELFVDAAHLLRAYKENGRELRHKPGKAAGSLIVRDERMRVRARRAIEARIRQMERDPPRISISQIERELSNLRHAARNIRTLEEATSPGTGLRPGKLYVVAHGGRGHERVFGGGSDVRGRSLEVIGRETAAIAVAGQWEKLDQRLASCHSGEARHAWGRRRASPMVHLDRGSVDAGLLAPPSIHTHGYQGYVLQGPRQTWSRTSDLDPGVAKWSGYHHAVTGPAFHRSPRNWARALTRRERGRVRDAFERMERRYYSALDDGTPSPGAARSGGRRLTPAALDELSRAYEPDSIVQLLPRRGKRVAEPLARMSMYRRLARGPTAQ